MIRAGDLDYALARVAARFGERPGEAAWRSLTVIRGLPALLDAARSTPFRRWVTGISPDADPHAIEAALRANVRALVDEVRLWMPPEWQRAIAWAGLLVELPVVQYLARRGAPLPWMRGDAVFGDLADDTAIPDAAGPLAPLAATWSDPDGFARAWRAEWQRRVPRDARSDRALLGEFARILDKHRGALAEPVARDGALPRRVLASRLTLLYRRAISDPAAVFIFLALSALDLERLRGDLLRRAIFPRFGVAA
ncbi:MAG: hypothetical protein ABI569_16370 [Casimicrobiaceae bacterium]